MSFSSFIKENRVLAAGLIMPLALVLVLVVLKRAPDYMVADPAYVAVFTSSEYDWLNGTQPVKLEITQDHHIGVNFTPPKPKEQNTPYGKAPLYVYDPATKTVSKTDIELDKTLEAPALEKFSHMIFSSDYVAPDGYVWQDSLYRDTPFLMDMFASRHNTYGAFLTKNNKVITITPRTDYTTYTFLGWVQNDAVKK